MLLGPAISNQTLQFSRKFVEVNGSSFLVVNILVNIDIQQLVLLIITDPIIVNQYRKFEAKCKSTFRDIDF